MASQSFALREYEVLALPAIVRFYPEACQALGMGRSLGYESHKTGQFPVPVLTVGKRLRVRRADLISYLGLNDTEAKAG